jgi:hypothetical protein
MHVRMIVGVCVWHSQLMCVCVCVCVCLCAWCAVVDEAQSDAWVLAVRNARHWFESIMDEHPTRRLFGGLGGEEDGPMLEQNYNPLSASNTGTDDSLVVSKPNKKSGGEQP